MKLLRAIIILLVCTLYGSMAHAQGWQKVIDFGGTDEGAISVVAANGGGYIVAGATRPSIATPSYSAVIFKIDENGQRLWTTFIRPSETINVNDMVKTAAGDVLLCGYMGITQRKDMFVAKISATGDSLWFKRYSKSNVTLNGLSLVEMDNGNLIVDVNYFDSLATTNGAATAHLLLNSNGDSLALKTGNLALGIRANKIVRTFDGGTVCGGNANLGTMSACGIIKTNSVGDTLWTKFYVDANSNMFPMHTLQTADSGIVLTGFIADNVAHTNSDTTQVHSFMLKTDKNGSELWRHTYIEARFITYSQAVIEDAHGNLIMCDHTENPNQSASYHFTPMFRMTDANGIEIKRKMYPELPGAIAEMIDIAPTPSGGFLMAGGKGFYRTLEDVYLIRTDSIGNIYPGRISGKVYRDANRNCTLNTLEQKMTNWIVKASLGTQEYFTTSDTLGNYTVESDTGTYNLSIIDPTNYWATDSTCTDSIDVHVVSATDTVYRNISMSPRFSAPYMQIQLNAPLVRTCIQGPAYVVDYSNLGTLPATNSYAEIVLDSALVLDSSSRAYTALGSNTYRFNLGTVGINEHGNFQMHIRAACGTLLGSTECVSAHIYPDSSATPPLAIWDHSNLAIESVCGNDSLLFKVTNTGIGNMNSTVQYRIIQDDVLYATGNIRLNAAAQFMSRVPANGSTWTFVTTQTVGHPGNDRPILSVEGCGTNSQGTYSTGYALTFPVNDLDPFVDVLCLPARASYDPNEKRAEPLGVGIEGTIDQSQPLTYSIGFQNTGTDTAFTVVVVDTLSNLLDLSTLKITGSSHPYHYTLLNGVLEFIFYPIQLPDSNVNEVASHGFINFIISPKANLPVGTQIRNTGYIYFDTNPPVVTNTTLNTIGELYKLWLSVTEVNDISNSLHCYPNPTAGKLMLEYKGTNEEATFAVYDVLGKVVFEQRVIPGLQQMDISSLNSGIYIYKLTGKGETASGKITKF